jgi:hypothetical protein
MIREERVRELCAQLFRAENPVVIETVAAQLHVAIEEYVQDAKRRMPNIELISLTPETV